MSWSCCVGIVFSSFFFFTAIQWINLGLKNVKGVWHCQCLYPKMFRHVQATDKSQCRIRKRKRKKERPSFSSKGTNVQISLGIQPSPLVHRRLGRWRLSRETSIAARSSDCCYSMVSSTWQKFSSQTKTCFLPFLSTFTKTHSLLLLIITWQRQV